MFLAALLYACAGTGHVQTPEPQFTATPSPTSLVYVPAYEWPTPEPTPTPTPEPTPVPTPIPIPTPAAQVHAAEVRPSGFYWDQDPVCLARPDRYDWKTYALAAGFPEHVVNGEEMAELIRQESGGDLCAVNDYSGATCWIQQYHGGPQFLDPVSCMSQGYSKWKDGGESFYAHWYAHW